MHDRHGVTSCYQKTCPWPADQSQTDAGDDPRCVPNHGPDHETGVFSWPNPVSTALDPNACLDHGLRQQNAKACHQTSRQTSQRIYLPGCHQVYPSVYRQVSKQIYQTALRLICHLAFQMA